MKVSLSNNESSQTSLRQTEIIYVDNIQNKQSAVTLQNFIKAVANNFLRKFDPECVGQYKKSLSVDNSYL